MLSRNPHIPYTRPLLPGLEKVHRLLEEIWDRGVVTNYGPIQAQFEESLRPALGGGTRLFLANGYSALRTMLAALGAQGQVIVSSFTHPATVQAVLASGLEPVAVDIDPHDLNISVEAVAAAVAPETIAILATHVFGNPSDIDELSRLADAHSLLLLFDAAAAVGVTYRGRPIGEYGNASAFSFHATKVLSAVEGGAVVFNDTETAAKARSLANFGIAEGGPLLAGMNAKGNEITAAIGLASLPLLADEIEARARLRQQYSANLEALESMSVVPIRISSVYNHSTFAVRARTVDGRHLAEPLQEYLRARGIESRRYFSGRYSNPMLNDRDHPHATQAGEDVICLPLWGSMSARDVDEVCRTISDFLSEASLR
ncbi:DegT/DnrJ/EryC1/StrS family aminotransferase [Streptomyces sp. DSM 40907]|uniref:DegT/DnrJ/EryC1/StrS family aminotransferase n=1 Tax=Streptomyces kutzneri TaxID=3051179 RepID=UPI0028D28637|nr:aminotransferase class I/II-fold pyridoxal phosphate-dependent enzyme [Streptomyces sp. DSM 40907]